MRSFGVLLLVVLSLAIFSGCGEKETAPAAEKSQLFLKMTLGGIERSSEPKTYVGEDLYEYIDGGAELYHQYGFVQVSTAYYAKGEDEVVADVFEFANSDHAYGLYSALRPDEFKAVAMGVEGFSATGSTVCVKGPYVVRVTGFDESSATANVIAKVASALTQQVPGTTDLPENFDLFPGMFATDHSEHLYAEGFMGRQFLTDVYTQDFHLDNDTLRLLLTEDNSGGKFLQWSTSVTVDSALLPGLSKLPFDGGQCFAFSSSFQGEVVVGLKSGYLIGMINYTESHEDFLNAWLEELPEPQ